MNAMNIVLTLCGFWCVRLRVCLDAPLNLHLPFQSLPLHLHLNLHSLRFCVVCVVYCCVLCVVCCVLCVLRVVLVCWCVGVLVCCCVVVCGVWRKKEEN